MVPALNNFLVRCQARCNQRLQAIVATKAANRGDLAAAMSYSLFNGGKRIRPVLVYAAAEAVDEITSTADNFACAVECIHAYSLIHDDLPAMDNDALRRGKPTCHIAFGEATAILAGDALQALAFEIIAEDALAGDTALLAAIRELALAAGMNGMALGQAIDLGGVGHQLDSDEIETMHRLKTAALIEASTVLGALSAGATGEQIDALRRYAQAVGLAFQVQDDILDVTADTATLGKQQGADADRDKPTYVSLLGLDGARRKTGELRQTAIEALSIFGKDAQLLTDLANYIVDRNH